VDPNTETWEMPSMRAIPYTEWTTVVHV